MASEYLTIKDFADLVGVSPQSIYKRMKKENNPIKPYLKEVKGVQCISKAAAVLYKAAAAAEETENIIIEKEVKQPQPEKNSMERLLDILETQLIEKDKQLIEKDKQLNEKDKQIEKLLNQITEITKIIDQQQQLTALNHKSLIIEQKEKEEQPEPEPQPEPEQQQKEKKWKWFFKK